jgi:hypothetical protein
MRGVFITRNLFIIPGMRKLRTRLKTSIRRCYQGMNMTSFPIDLNSLGATDVLFLLILLFIATFMFAVIGTKSFGGLIQTSGDDTYPSLRDSPYGRNNYYVLNFNDVVSSLGTLYTLLLVNNMQITASGFTAISYDIPAKAFFVCWYVIGVLFLLNLLTASLLSSFLSIWILQKKIIVEGEQKEKIVQHSHTSGTSDESSIRVPSFSNLDCSPLEPSSQYDHDLYQTSTRVRSNALTINTSDNMFDWFRVGSTVWEGEQIDLKKTYSGTISIYTVQYF